MKEKYKEVILIGLAILMALSLIFNYASDYYSSVEESSANWLIFSTVSYTASHLFCEDGYKCTYSDLSYPEFQRKELQKFQDQVDMVHAKAGEWKQVSNLLIWISLVINIILITLIWRDNKKI